MKKILSLTLLLPFLPFLSYAQEEYSAGEVSLEHQVSTFNLHGSLRKGNYQGLPFVDWWKRNGIITVPFSVEKTSNGSEATKYEILTKIAADKHAGGTLLITLSKDSSPSAKGLKQWEVAVPPTGSWATYKDHSLKSLSVSQAGDFFLHLSIKSMNREFINMASVTFKQLGPTKGFKVKGKSSFKEKFTEGKGNDLNAVAKTAEEQRKLFKLPEGFVIELVSDETQGLIKPISINFDEAGRLWTQTASEYPRDRQPQAFFKKGKDKILVFDTPWAKGKQQPRTFADGLVMPISVLPYKGEIRAILGPNIISLEDTNGDGKADKKTDLLTGFGVQDSHTCIHRLTRAPGGWMNFSQGVNVYGTITTKEGKKQPFNQALIARTKLDGSKFEIIGEGLNNIWAWSINREGRTFIHEANNLGYSQVAFERDATYPSFLATQSRNKLFHPPQAQELPMDGTGFCGIASGGNSSRDFPGEWNKFNYIANPITGEINVVRYSFDKLGNPNFTRMENLVSCEDTMFRPVNLSFGPDGALYIVDWYNRTISHGTTTRNLTKHDRTRGRIWRVRHKSQKPYQAVNVEKASNKQLIKHLISKNLWERRAAWHQIEDRQAKELKPNLIKIIQKSKSSSLRIHALWVLESLKVFDYPTWKLLLTSDNQNVRHEAIRAMSTVRPPLDQAMKLLQPLKNEKSYYVINEIARFFRDYPAKLTSTQIQFARQWYTAEADLPNNKVKGWKHSYFALDGSYQKRHLNQIIEQIGKKKNTDQIVDETKWSRTIAKAKKLDKATDDKLNKEISRLEKYVGKAKNVNAFKGKQHYAARCAPCHDNSFAPPLGTKLSTHELLASILKPNDAIEDAFRVYRIIKKDGSAIEGFRSDITPKEITLTFMGGGQLKVPMKDVKEAGYVDGKSVMISGMINGMKDQEVAELIHFLQGKTKGKKEPKKAPATKVSFKKIQLLDKYITEGASVADVDNDGKMDVIAGPLWWKGPDFKESFSYAPVKVFPTKGPGMSAYSNNFFTFPGKITRDEWIDIVKVGLPNTSAEVAINPGQKKFDPSNKDQSCEHCFAQSNICNESPQYVNVIGDKKVKELICFHKGHITLAYPSADPKKPWTVLNITPKRFPTWIHGLGVGDINGDGLPDVMENKGWWEQPKNWDRKSHWKHHPYTFAPQQGGAQMFAYDIDGDGDNDVATALNAHRYGFAWYEQTKDANGKITFKKHTIMTDKAADNPYGVSFSQPHAMDMGDIDGDGIPDLVTGKCYYAHNGKDPGAEDPAVLYWFKTHRHANGKAELIPYLIDDNSGVGRQITIADLNGDKKKDIVVGNKKGVFAFIQE